MKRLVNYKREVDKGTAVVNVSNVSITSYVFVCLVILTLFSFKFSKITLLHFDVKFRSILTHSNVEQV